MQARQAQMGDEVPLRGSSEGELEDAVSRCLPLFYRRAYRYVGDPHDAEDAVQDALLSAYRHLHQFKGTAKMTTWLTSIVTNSSLTKLRRRPRQPHVSLDERVAERQDYCLSETLADARPSAESEYIRAELHGHLMRSVMGLSPSMRKAIQLRYVDGLTTKQIANILGVPHGTVKAQVSRGRAKLKRQMQTTIGKTSVA